MRTTNHGQRPNGEAPRQADRLASLALLTGWLLVAAGCGPWSPRMPRFRDAHFPGPRPESPPESPMMEVALLENPICVPMSDVDFVWDQVVDAIDDYFKIQREERLRLVGNVLNEGRLETFPTIGSTVFEPWKSDATPGFERWQSTLQSIQRRASARVSPGPNGFQIEVVVGKELEDLYQPEHATVGGTTLRYDGSVVRSDAGTTSGPVSLGWIPIGRDIQLEQRILADIHARLVGPDVPSP